MQQNLKEGKIFYLQNLIKLIFVYFLCIIGCTPELPHTYNPEKARKIYTEHLQAIIKLSEKIDSSRTDTMVYLNYYSKWKTPFMGVDTIADYKLANIIGGVVAYLNKNEHKKSAAALKIGTTCIYHYPIFEAYPIRPISCLYNTQYNTYYAWLPFDFAVLAFSIDTATFKKYTPSRSSQHTKIAKAYYYDLTEKNGGFYPLEWTYSSIIPNRTYTLQTTDKFSIISLKKTLHYNLLKNIIFELDVSKNVADMLKLLQNQCNYASFGVQNSRCYRFVDSSNTTLYVLADTCKLTTTPILFLDIYEKMSVADLAALELIYPDLTKEKIPEIADYAQKTKPTFIYFKRAYRNGFRGEPYYYFLFYYIDFMPFMRPQLRDMQVIFPRRFGLS